MAWFPIAKQLIQYYNPSTNVPYSGGVLKAYTVGTTTNINFATDRTGATQVSSIALNSSGYPEVGGAMVIPHIETDFKLSLYPSQSAADSDTGELWSIDNIEVDAFIFDTTIQPTGYTNTKAVADWIPQVNTKKNFLWQGNFQVWQRGISFDDFSAREGVADGWSFARSGFTTGAVVSQSQGEKQIYSLKVQRSSGDSNTQSMNLCVNLSREESLFLAGKNVTYGFRGKKGANFSASSLFCSLRYTSHSSEQSIINASGQYSTGDTFLDSIEANLITDFSDYKDTATIPSSATQIQMRFQFIPVGTAGVDDSFTIEEVFLIDGDEKANIEHQSFEEAFQFAQKEYMKSYNYDTQGGIITNAGALCAVGDGTSSSSEVVFNVPFNYPMRTPPTITLYNPVDGNDGEMRNITDNTDISVNASNIGTNGFVIEPATIGESYLEGDFDPAFGSVTVTYVSQTGRYTQKGNLVYFEGQISYNTLDTTDTSNIQIFVALSGTDAPKMANNGFGFVEFNLATSTGLSLAAGDRFNFSSASNAGLINITNISGTEYGYNDSKISASGIIEFSGFYLADSASTGRKKYSVHYVAEARL